MTITDPEKILVLKNLLIKTDQEYILNHHVEVFHKTQIYQVMLVGVVQLNVNDDLAKYRLRAIYIEPGLYLSIVDTVLAMNDKNPKSVGSQKDEYNGVHVSR